MAGNHDFNLDQGVTWNRTIAIARDSVPVNLTGYTGRMQLRRNKSQNKANISLTTENAGLVIIPGTGHVTINISAAQSSELTGNYVYDLKLIHGSTVTRWLEGNFIVSNEVTR